MFSREGCSRADHIGASRPARAQWVKRSDAGYPVALAPRDAPRRYTLSDSLTPETKPIDIESEVDESERDTIVFLGDSITQEGRWADWFPEARAINHGVGGDTTDAVLARLDDVIAESPDEIALLIGTNDLGTRQNVEHLVRNVETICVTLRRALPGSRMLVQSVMPRGREFASRIQEANIHIRQFTSTVHAQFLDLWPALALADGELNPAYSDDRLHLTDAGYDAWLGELRPALARLRDAPPMTTPIQVIRPDQYSRPPR